MKKLFTYIAMFAAAVSCMDDMYGPQQTPIEPVASKGIDVTVLATGDSTVTFVLAPKGESTYYSYLVDKSDKAEALDSSAVFACSYDGVAAGTIKWTAAAPKDTVTIKDLAPNSTYQIYAVAGSTMGIPSAVVNTSFKTSDKVSPTLMDYETADSVVVLYFDEPVVRDTAKIVAGIYAMNSAQIEKGVAVAAIEVAEDCITVNGTEVEINVKGLPAGAFYSINFGVGAFKDLSNNPADALASTVTYSSETEWEPKYEGVGGRNAEKFFKLGQIEDEKYTTTTPAYLLTFESEYGYGYTYSRKGGVATYTMGSKTTTYKLVGGTDFDYSSKYGGVVLYLPTAGDPGNTVVIDIDEGVFEDYFGNFNEAWTDELLYSYDYKLADIVGNYEFISYENFSSANMKSTFTIAESTKPEKGNVMFTTFAGIPCQAPIYGNFNFDSGILNVAKSQAFYQANATTLYVFHTYSNDSVNFAMTSSGEFTSADDYFGIAVANNGKLTGWGYLFLNFEAYKVAAAEPTPTATAIPSFSDSIQPINVEIAR